ncbi:MAG: hypothetical protein IIB66_04285, partial [Proteobacteria bacterium]|nr:hypothetical protein [Pseudomonadota bacterium]
MRMPALRSQTDLVKDSVVDAPRLQHSAKPAEFYEIIERMYPDANRLELFLRGEPREGWD